MTKNLLESENSSIVANDAENGVSSKKSQRFFEFVKLHKNILIFSVCSVFLFFSGLWLPLMIFPCVIISIFYFFSNTNDKMKGFMFFLFFSGVKVFFFVNLVSFILSILIHYVIDVVKKKEKVYVLPLTLTILLLLIWGLIHYDVGKSGLEQGSLLITIFIALYLFFVIHKSIKIKDSFNYFALGLIFSGVLGALTFVFNSYAHEIVYVDEICSRLTLFTLHTNHLSMNCLFLISYEIYQIVNKKDKLIKCILIIAIALVAGLLTQSKAFIIVCIGLAGYSCICLILRYKLKSLRVIIPLAVVAVILGVVFRGYLGGILERFFAYNLGMSAINQITTGRSGIWFAYMEQTRSSVLKMLFGVGLFSNELVSIGPHNVYLFILSRFGFIGIIFIGVIVYSYIISSERLIKPTFYNILPLLTYFVLSLEEMILSERFFIFFIFALMFMIQDDSTEIGQVDKNYDTLEKLINKDIKLIENDH